VNIKLTIDGSARAILREAGKDPIKAEEETVRRLLVTVAALLVTIGAVAPARAELKVGDKAPDFTLPDQNGNKVTLSEFLGKKNVVLAFYVLAFTGG